MLRCLIRLKLNSFRIIQVGTQTPAITALFMEKINRIIFILISLLSTMSRKERLEINWCLVWPTMVDPIRLQCRTLDSKVVNNKSAHLNNKI